MRKTAGLFFLLTCLSFIGAQDSSIDGVSYLPKNFFVGDIVEMRVELPAYSVTDIVIPEILPQADWFLYRQVEVQPYGDGIILRVLFSSYQPGIRLIPPLDLGGFVLSDIRVDTASVLDKENNPLTGTAEPLFLPKTGLYFGVIVACLLGIPMVIIVLFKGIRGRIKTAIINARRRQPHTRLMKIFRELDRRILNRDGNLFYTILTEEFKKYLSQRSGEDFSTLTGRETGKTLKRFYSDEEFLPSLDKLFSFAEEVKFGGRDPYTSRKREDLNASLKALEGLEVFYHQLWNKTDELEEAAHVDGE